MGKKQTYSYEIKVKGTSYKFQQVVKENGVIMSMSCKGTLADNAVLS
ncbi:MAG: hypothetical protein ACI4XN_00925 [Candidatus Kurthia intestinigallinarum]